MEPSAAVVTSRDGTSIRYSVDGAGPAVVLVHGAMQTSANFAALAGALARSYRVVRYDRRGRGANAAGGNDTAHRFDLEVQDLAAVVGAVDARRVFGLSSGAILTMGAALAVADLEGVALYEPPLAIGDVDPGWWSEAFLDDVARGRLGRAMARILKGTADRSAIAYVPRAVLGVLFGLAVRQGAKAPSGETLRDLLLTVRSDIAVQRQGSSAIPPFGRFAARTLLLGGDRSHPDLTRILDRLERDLPNARRVTIRGAGHIAADNHEKPLEVAHALADFFGR